MSIEMILQPLEKLTSLHKSLNNLSLQKTTCLKKGSIDEFQQILMKERKIVQAAETTEKTRVKAVKDWLNMRGIDKEGTVTEVLNTVPDAADQEKLAALSATLTEEITKLKQNEQLNQALLKQSLQFVKMSLDLMDPTLNNMNYGKQSESLSNRRSVFDSKA